MRRLTSLAGLVCLFSVASFAQDSQTAYCDFTDGGEVSMRYNPAVKDEPRNGRVWSPGITLFVQVPLTLGGSEITIGAYAVYLIPDRKNWTLIVNKNVTAGAVYNSSQD